MGRDPTDLFCRPRDNFRCSSYWLPFGAGKPLNGILKDLKKASCLLALNQIKLEIHCIQFTDVLHFQYHYNSKTIWHWLITCCWCSIDIPLELDKMVRHALRCDLSDVLNATGKVALLLTKRRRSTCGAPLPACWEPSSSSVKQVSVNSFGG